MISINSTTPLIQRGGGILTHRLKTGERRKGNKEEKQWT
jgi:hypothetical protein